MNIKYNNAMYTTVVPDVEIISYDEMDYAHDPSIGLREEYEEYLMNGGE